MRMMWLRRVDGTGVGAVCSVSVFVRAKDAVMAFVILSVTEREHENLS